MEDETRIPQLDQSSTSEFPRDPSSNVEMQSSSKEAISETLCQHVEAEQPLCNEEAEREHVEKNSSIKEDEVSEPLCQSVEESQQVCNEEAGCEHVNAMDVPVAEERAVETLSDAQARGQDEKRCDEEDGIIRFREDPSELGSDDHEGNVVDSAVGNDDAEEANQWPGAEERDKYVHHFRKLLELERLAEEAEVLERLERPVNKLEMDGLACTNLWPEKRPFQTVSLSRNRGIPHLQEMSVGRTVLLTPQRWKVRLDDPPTTAIGEIAYISNKEIIVQCDSFQRGPLRLDLGPNTVSQRRLNDVMSALANGGGIDPWVHGLGLLSPGTPLASCIFASCVEPSEAIDRENNIERMELPELAKAPPYTAPSPPWVSYPSGMYRKANQRLQDNLQAPSPQNLNSSQKLALRASVHESRQIFLIQGPPGTGKTATSVEIVLGWLRQNKGPILATAFSNKGVNNLADALWAHGANVVRVGISNADLPYSVDSHLKHYGFERSDRSWRKMKEVLGGAHVVCATCIGAGMSVLSSIQFPYVIIDEAAQSIEPATLIPLARGSVQAVLVGDHCQLPATVLSCEAREGRLDHSLFERLVNLNVGAHLLSVQYRMHPQISAFPSWRFYDSNLLTGVHPDDRKTPALRNFDGSLSSVVFIHVDGIEQGAQGQSKSNPREAACVRFLLEHLECEFPDVGVITPYSAQAVLVRRELKTLASAFNIQVSSVDGFQGAEKEVIILTLVRSNTQARLGFVSDWRRLNVAVTRARSLLVAIGNLHTLCTNDLWKDFVGVQEGIQVREWKHDKLSAPSDALEELLINARAGVSMKGFVQPPLAPETTPGACLRRSTPAVPELSLQKSHQDASNLPASPESSSNLEVNHDRFVSEGPDGIRVKARRKLLTPGAAGALRKELVRIVNHAPALIADFDVAQNPLDSREIKALLELLSRPGVQVERLRFFGCDKFGDEAIGFLADFLENGKPGAVPFELHLSDCAVTSKGFLKLMDAVETSIAFPCLMKNLTSSCPTSTRQPLYLCLENNFIDESVIQHKIAVGIIETCQNTQVCRNMRSAANTSKVRLLVSKSGGFSQRAIPCTIDPRASAEDRSTCAKSLFEELKDHLVEPRLESRMNTRPSSEDWANCLIQSAYLRTCKRKAVENEDYDLAQLAKKAEISATDKLARARQKALAADVAKLLPECEWYQLQVEKQRAVEKEDYDLAAQLKRKQTEVEDTFDLDAELDCLRERKRRAVAKENYDEAGTLQNCERQIMSLAAKRTRDTTAEAISRLGQSGPAALDLDLLPPELQPVANGMGINMLQSVEKMLSAEEVPVSGKHKAIVLRIADLVLEPSVSCESHEENIWRGIDPDAPKGSTSLTTYVLKRLSMCCHCRANHLRQQIQ